MKILMEEILNKNIGLVIRNTSKNEDVIMKNAIITSFNGQYFWVSSDGQHDAPFINNIKIIALDGQNYLVAGYAPEDKTFVLDIIEQNE